jgi:glc operon protein GlcG
MALPLLTEKRVLTLAAAKRVAEAAEHFALGSSWSVVIAIMDDGGNLLYLQRMDGAPIGSVGVAQEKARTSAIFKSSTKGFESALASGLTSLLKLEILPFEGGLPIAVNGTIAGAIGVSGCAMSAQDGQVAQAGVDWLSKELAAATPCSSAL